LKERTGCNFRENTIIFEATRMKPRSEAQWMASLFAAEGSTRRSWSNRFMSMAWLSPAVGSLEAIGLSPPNVQPNEWHDCLLQLDHLKQSIYRNQMSIQWSWTKGMIVLSRWINSKYLIYVPR
jgi:hypothetical protein